MQVKSVLALGISILIVVPTSKPRGAAPQGSMRFVPQSLNAPRIAGTNQIKITQPGSYLLTEDVTYSPSVSDNLIKITSSNVHLDLNTRTVYLPEGISSSLAIHGIYIADGLSNITINNGSIFNVTGIGIKVGANCYNLHLHNLNINSAAECGIKLDTNTRGTVVENCSVGLCNSRDTDAIGILVKNSLDINITDCSFCNNKAPAGFNGYGIKLSSSINCDLLNIQSNSNEGDNVVGIYLDNCQNCLVKNSESNFNSATAGNAAGIQLISTQTTALVKNFTSSNHASNDAIGILLTNQSIGNEVIKCVTSGQYSSGTGNGIGIHFQRGSGNFISSCRAINNRGGSSSTSNGVGLLLDTEYRTLIKGNIFDGNTSNAGKGYGICLKDTKWCAIKDNSAFHNTGTVGGWGIFENNDSTSYIIHNEAFANTTKNYEIPLSSGSFPYKEEELKKINKLPDLNSIENVSVKL